MSFSKTLSEGCFCLNLRSTTKAGVIEEMVDLMAQAGKIADRQEAIDAVLDRERRMSTGMQHGVAVPHGKIASVDGLVTAFALKKDGVDFESLDGQPARIFVMTISSINRTGPHIQYLAEIGKLLSKPSVRERLLRAESVAEVTAILSPPPAAGG